MRKVFLVFLTTLLFFSCRDKIICPAFQSTYILDDQTRQAYYSYVWKLDKETREKYLASAYGQTDSLAAGNAGTMRYYDYVADIIQPREEVRRSKYGIVKYEPMWLKNYELKTAPKENILGPEPEKVKEVESIDTGEFIASDFYDSLATDSTSIVIEDTLQSRQEPVRVALEKTQSKKKEVKYLYRYDPDSLNNAEQEYYNKYYGQLLIDYSEQRKKQQDQLNLTQTDKQLPAVSDSTQSSETGKKSLFKKSKQATESKSETESGESQEESEKEDEGF